jgi:predicted ester cyclase
VRHTFQEKDPISGAARVLKKHSGYLTPTLYSPEVSGYDDRQTSVDGVLTTQITCMRIDRKAITMTPPTAGTTSSNSSGLTEVEAANFAAIDGVLPFWATKDIPGIVSFYTDEITWHPIAEDRCYRGKEDVSKFFQQMFSAIPDMDFVLTTKISRGNFISEEFRMRGTQIGPYMGIPPTGKTVEIYGMSMARWKDAKLHADEFLFDGAEVMRQLGVLPAVLSPYSPVGRAVHRAASLFRRHSPKNPERLQSIHLSSSRHPRAVLDIDTLVRDSHGLTDEESRNLAKIHSIESLINNRDVTGLTELLAVDATAR